MSSITIQPDETSGIDSYNEVYGLTTNHATDTILRVGGESALPTSLVIKHDLSSLAGATIVSATISLRCVSFGGNQTLNFYGCLRNWIENQVCGQYYSGTNAWSSYCGTGSGTDRDASAAGAMSVTGTGNFSASLSISLIQSWVNGSRANYGLVGFGYFGNNVYNDFASSSEATSAYRPKLVIEYLLPSGASMAVMSEIGVAI